MEDCPRDLNDSYSCVSMLNPPQHFLLLDAIGTSRSASNQES